MPPARGLKSGLWGSKMLVNRQRGNDGRTLMQGEKKVHAG